MKFFIIGLIVGIILGMIGLTGALYGLYQLYKKYAKVNQKKPKHIYNLKKDKPDPRDFRFRAVKPRTDLPDSVDLRDKMSSVVDQGNLGSCTANAIVSGLREYLLLNQDKPDNTRLSRLFLYYLERELEGTIGEDSGAYIRDGMKVLQKTGVCPEDLWPYIVKKFTKKPSQTAYDAAGKYKITEYQRVNNLDEAKAALADGCPVVFGFDVYESFESDEVAKTGIMPMPADGESLLGGHAVLAAGYDDAKGYLIVRNSWSDSWGDKGYFYMPYEAFNKYTSDLWTGK